MSIPSNILIIEPEYLASQEIREILGLHGYPGAVVAHSIPQAEAVVLHRRPGAVLLDVRLRQPEELAFVERLTREFHIPVIYLNANRPVAKVEWDQHPCGYILKPFHLTDLRHTLNSLFTKSAPIEEVSQPFIGALSAREAVIITDIAGHVTYLNPLAEELTGWRLSDAYGRPYQDVFRLVNADGEPQHHRPYGAEDQLIALRTKNGDLLKVEDHTTTLTDQQGSLAGLAIVFRERTETMREPVEEGASLNHLVSIVEGIADPLFAMDENWRITFVNNQAAKYFGKPREQLVGGVFWDQFPNSVHSQYYQDYSQPRDRQKPHEFEFYHESKQRWLDVLAYPFAKGVLVFLRDITERKQAQERGRKAEKLESLGLLARGFAHDFNNVLTVLLGNLSIAGMRTPHDDAYPEALRAAKESTLQAQSMVQQLLTFARGGAPIKAMVDLNHEIREVLDARKKKTSIDYRLDLEEGPLIASVDSSQIRRLIDNLIDNAEEAMPRGGGITLSARRCPSSMRPEIEAADLDPETDHLLIEVCDEGEGIPGTELEKVFEPYYSTRTDANATGLGLTVCESIAVAHHGALSVNSKVGAYTRVRLLLPSDLPASTRMPFRSDSPFRTAAESAAEASRIAMNNTEKQILILEDDVLIRRLIVLTLKREGYQLEEAPEGSVAVDAYRRALEKGRPFDLVIMDLSIPNGMGGAEAIKQIRSMDPDVVALVSSGYSDDPIMSNYRSYGFTAVLPKPYEPGALSRMVKQILASRDRSIKETSVVLSDNDPYDH